ncbi:MAG: hypothetical protein U1E65_07860 [Myxococcota bacterium]
MASELIDELIRRGRIDGREAQRVGRHQLEHGGAYDTALLELGLADEAMILSAMATGLGRSVANPSSVRSPPDPGALRAFPEQWAKKYTLAPLAFDRDKHEVSVLTVAPPDLPLMQRLSALLEVTIVPLLTTEIRVHERLHLLYGAPVPERFLSLLRGRTGRGDTTADLPPMPPPPDERALAEFQARVGRLKEARGRDEIVHLVLTQARTDFDFCAFFVVTDNQATGWSALGTGGENIARVQISEPRSAFMTAIRTQAHVLGPLPLEDQRILAQLERVTPRAALIIPVRVRERPVALIYAENGVNAISPRAASDLMLYSSHAGQALEDLLVRRKTALPRGDSAIVKTSLPPRPSLTAPPIPAAQVAPTMPAPEALKVATWDIEVASALEAQAARAVPTLEESEALRARTSDSPAARAARDLVNAFVEQEQRTPLARMEPAKPAPRPQSVPAPRLPSMPPVAEPLIPAEMPAYAETRSEPPLPPQPVSLGPPIIFEAPVSFQPPALPIPEPAPEAPPPEVAPAPSVEIAELSALEPGPIPEPEFAVDEAPPAMDQKPTESPLPIRALPREPSGRPTDPPAAPIIEPKTAPIFSPLAGEQRAEEEPPPADATLEMATPLPPFEAEPVAEDPTTPIALPGVARRPSSDPAPALPAPDAALALAALQGQAALTEARSDEDDEDPFSDKSIALSEEEIQKLELRLPPPREEPSRDALPVPPLASDLPRPAQTASGRPATRRSVPPAPSADRPRWESQVEAAFTEWSARPLPVLEEVPSAPPAAPEPPVPELRRETWVRASSRVSRPIRVAEEEDQAEAAAPAQPIELRPRAASSAGPGRSDAVKAAEDLARAAADPGRSVAELTRAREELSVAASGYTAPEPVHAAADLVRTLSDSPLERAMAAPEPTVRSGGSAAARRAGDALSAPEIPRAIGVPTQHEAAHVLNAAGQIEARPSEPQEEPAPEATAVVDRSRSVGPEQLNALIDQLESPDLDRRGAARAALLHHQDAALPLLMSRFPGRVTVDPFALTARIPGFAACGELLQTLAAMGAAAQVPIAERLDDPLPIVRYFALHYFGSFTVPEAIPRLVRRLHDEEQEIASLAVSVLTRYRDLPQFKHVLTHLHARFASRTPNARRHAARLLALFRDPTAVPLLIDVFEKKEKTFFDAAEEALAAITKQRLGPNAKKWSTWWEAHARTPRAEWLLEGLDSADVDLRRSAAQELRAMSGFDSGFDENAPRRTRDDAKKKWLSWWALQNGGAPTRAR